MKYIDLHLHLDGSISKDIARFLAKEQNIILPNDFERKLSVDQGCTDLNEYLEKFSLPLSLLQTKWAITQAVKLVQQDLKNNGVIYAEIRFAPQLHTQKGLTQREVIQSALDGLKLCEIDCNIILCLMRGDQNQEQNRETVTLCKEFLAKDNGVVALDLAGAEALYPTKDFEDLFALAKKLDIPFTIHAGEADGYISVNDAVHFGAKRIGHAVHARESKDLLDEIKQKGIGIEMCPTSNLQTKAVSSIADHPLKKYLEKGILATVNTDNPTVSNTTIQKEFELAGKMGLTETEINTLKLNAVEIAFCSEETKKQIKNAIINFEK